MQKLLILAALADRIDRPARIGTNRPCKPKRRRCAPRPRPSDRGRHQDPRPPHLARRRRSVRQRPDYDIEGKNDVRQCRRDTRSVASAQADVVVASASRDQLIQVSSIRN